MRSGGDGKHTADRQKNTIKKCMQGNPTPAADGVL